MMCCGVRFRTCVLPEGLTKELFKVMKIQTCLDIIGYTMVLTIPICKSDAQNITDAFKHVPELLRLFILSKSKAHTEIIYSSRKLILACGCII